MMMHLSLFGILLLGLGASAAPFNFQPQHPINGLNELQAIESVRHSVELYPLYVDSKNFSAFSEIFTSDLVATYAPCPVFHGPTALGTFLQDALSPVVTQHHLGTQVIDIIDRNSANATTYIRAFHFAGSGVGPNQTLEIFGRYEDQLRPGPDGVWKIFERNSIVMVCLPSFRRSFIEHYA